MMLKRGWAFHQDIEPKHTAFQTMKNLHGRQIEVSGWQPQAPDLLKISGDVKRAMQFKESKEYFRDNR